MKKISQRKLTLNAETIKRLDDSQLSGVAGAWPTGACLTTTCPTTSQATACQTGCPSGYTACLCFSVNRTNC